MLPHQKGFSILELLTHHFSPCHSLISFAPLYLIYIHAFRPYVNEKDSCPTRRLLNKQFILLTFASDDDYILTMDANFIYKEFGRRLRGARTVAGLTQGTLAGQVGLNRTSITNIEKGRQHIPLHLLFSLASAVGVAPAALLPERKSVPEPDVINKKQLEKQDLKQAQENYVTTLVARGMIRKKEQEDKK